MLPNRSLTLMLLMLVTMFFGACSNPSFSTKKPETARKGDKDSSDSDAKRERGGGEDDEDDDLLSRCGVSDLSDLDKVVYQKGYSAQVLDQGSKFIVNYAVMVQIDLNVESTLRESRSTVLARPVNIQSNMFSGIVQKEAEKEAKAASGSKTYKMLTPDEKSEFIADSKEWEGILCTVSAAKEVVNIVGEYVTTVTFDPPIPISISPKARSDVYAEELGRSGGREFTGITATISSTHPDLKDVTTLTGSVRIEPSASQMQGPNGEYAAGDIGFHVVNSFGSPEMTDAMGLQADGYYFIDHTEKAHSAIVTRDGDKQVFFNLQ